MASWRLWTPGDAERVQTAGPDHLVTDLRNLPTGTFDRTLPGSKLPRNHMARAYRFSTGPHLLAAVAVQYRRMRGCLELLDAVFPAETTSTELLQEMLVFTLTDAYRTSGICAVLARRPADAARRARFDRLTETAARAGVPLGRSGDTFISPEEGRRLYLALSGLSKPAREVIERLEANGRTRAESVVYLIHAGFWSPGEMETLLLGCPYPDVLLWGGAPPADRHLAELTYAAARYALLSGRLDRVLRACREDTAETSRALVDQPRPVTAWSEEGGRVRRFRLDEGSLELRDWARDGTSVALTTGDELVAFFLPRQREDLERLFPEEVHSAASEVRDLAPARVTALVVPSDFDQIAPERKQALLKTAAVAGIVVLVMPETFAQLNLEARRRLNLSRIIRR